MAQDWTEIWRAWVAPLSGFGSADAGRDPLRGAVDAYGEFVAAVQRALAAAGAGDGGDVARIVEALAAGLGGADGEAGQSWFAVPFAFAGTMLASPAFNVVEEAESRWSGWAEEFLDLPVFGPQREWIGTWQRAQRAALTQQRCERTLQRHYRRAAATALERFAAVLHAADAEALAAPRRLYDRWVDVAESAYHETVMSEAFSRDFGAWVNASATARKATAAVGERLSASADLPARAEVNRLLERQRELDQELEALRREIAELRKAPAGPAPRRDAAPGKPTAEVARQPQAARKAAAARKPAGGHAPRRQPKRAAGKTVKPALGEFDIRSITGSTD